MLVAVGVLVTSAVWLRGRSEAIPLVFGKPVSYWLDQRPLDDGSVSLQADNPLVQAGPEIIPSLISSIHRSYAGRDFINRFLGYFPPPYRKYFGARPPSGGLIRETAALRLGLMGSAASNAVPALLDLLKKPPSYFRENGRVIQALGLIGPSARQAVPMLVDSLDDKSDFIPMFAAYSLLRIGTVPLAASPALKRHLNDNRYVAALMAVALIAVNETPEAVLRVESMLVLKQDRYAQAHVAATLGLLRDVPDRLKPVLARMLEDQDANVRQGAAIGLARPEAENLSRIIEVLVEGLNNGQFDGQFQIQCAQALGRIGSAAQEAVPELKRAQGYMLGIAARDALRRIEQEHSSEPGHGVPRQVVTRGGPGH